MDRKKIVSIYMLISQIVVAIIVSTIDTPSGWVAAWRESSISLKGFAIFFTTCYICMFYCSLNNLVNVKAIAMRIGGFLIGNLPLLSTIFICLTNNCFNFITFFIIYFLLEVFLDAIMKQTRFYIMTTRPYTSMRSILENDIVNGNAAISSRIKLGLFYFVQNLLDIKHYFICAIISGIVVFIYNLLH